MRSKKTFSIALRYGVFACAFVIAGLAATLGRAQLRLGLSSRYELSPEVRVDEAERDARSQLERVSALVTNKNWEDAIEALRKLMASHGRQLIKMDSRRFVSLEDYCHWKLVSLPDEARRLYRDRVDPEAKRLYEKASPVRDEKTLERLVEEMFGSSYGDDALFLLGSIALERGDYDLARRRWERISPTLRTGDWKENELVSETRPGLPLWTAFNDVKLDEHWAELEPLLKSTSAPTSRLVYPDSNVSLADVRARLVLTSILEGDTPRAKVELDVFSRQHPTAKGRIAGREVVYREALAKLLKQSTDWPVPTSRSQWTTFAGASSRDGVVEHEPDVGAMLAGYPVALEHVARSNPAVAIRRGFRPKRVAEDHERLLSYHPIVVEDRVFVCDDARVKAFDLKTGKPAWGLKEPTIYEDDEFADASGGSQRSVGVARYTLSAHGDKLFARLGMSATSRPPGRARHGHSSSLVCLDLASEGRLVWKLPRAADAAEFEKARWAFEGPPVADGERVYVGMRRSGVRPELHVACYDATDGRMIWRRFICSAETPARGQEDECTHILLTLVRGRLFCNTNLGAVAALRATDGKIDWLYKYTRALSGRLLTPAAHWYRDLNPCIYHRGMVFVGPTDSPHLFALDTASGRLLWQTVEPPPELGNDPIHLLGVAQDHLIASGKMLWWINIHSGKIVARSHDAGRTGPDVYGRGLLVGDKIWWPTRDAILVYRQRPVKTVGRLQAPVSRTVLAGRGGAATGGNLVVSDGVLLIATPDSLIAFSDSNARKSHSRALSRSDQQGRNVRER